ARGDTATPVRATVISVVANVAMKIVLVWGLDLGVIGIALGTSFGAWVNFGMLAAMARKRRVLVATPELKRAIVPVIAATVVSAIGFFLGVLLGHALIAPGTTFYDLAAFTIAGAMGASVYALTVIALRRRLPLK